MGRPALPSRLMVAFWSLFVGTLAGTFIAVWWIGDEMYQQAHRARVDLAVCQDVNEQLRGSRATILKALSACDGMHPRHS